jgi:hypothetical protein
LRKSNNEKEKVLAKKVAHVKKIRAHDSQQYGVKYILRTAGLSLALGCCMDAQKRPGENQARKNPRTGHIT